MVEHIRDEECDVGVAHVLASVPADLMVVILQPLVAGCVPQLREPLAQREEGRTDGTIPSLQKTPSTCGSPSRARPVRGSRQTDRLRPVVQGTGRSRLFQDIRRTRSVRVTIGGSCVVDFGGLAMLLQPPVPVESPVTTGFSFTGMAAQEFDCQLLDIRPITLRLQSGRDGSQNHGCCVASRTVNFPTPHP